MTLDFNIFNLGYQLTNPHDEPLDINMIQELSSEHIEEEFFDKLDSLVVESFFSNMLDESSIYVSFTW